MHNLEKRIIESSNTSSGLAAANSPCTKTEKTSSQTYCYYLIGRTARLLQQRHEYLPNTLNPNTLFLIDLLRITTLPYLTARLPLSTPDSSTPPALFENIAKKASFSTYLTFSETSRAMRQPKMRPNVINIHTHY